MSSISNPSKQFWEGPALVIGVWTPGVQNEVVTLALDYSDQAAQLRHLIDPNFRPTFQGDLMAIPNERLGKHKYTRIVFQGCCPVATAMGGKSCGVSPTYDKINPMQLAHKLNELVSSKGGYLFFRHCVEFATKDGIASLSQREDFIKIFENEGFELVERCHAPMRLTQHAPGPEIPDPCPSATDKWEPQNGGMIFFKPPFKLANENPAKQ